MINTAHHLSSVPTSNLCSTTHTRPQKPLAHLLDCLKDSMPLSLHQQKQTLLLLGLFDKPANRDRPSKLKGRNITLCDEGGLVSFTWKPEESDNNGVIIQAQNDGLFNGVDEQGDQTASGSFLNTLLSTLRGAHVHTSQVETEDFARRLIIFARTHVDEVERVLESVELVPCGPASTTDASNNSSDVQENMLRNVLARTVSQVATRMAAQLLDQIIEGSILEGIKFDDIAQLKPAVEQFRRRERSLKLRLQSLANALGRVARTPDGVIATTQHCLELCLKTADLTDMIGTEGLNLNTVQRALVQLADALQRPPLRAWNEALGARSALLRTSQWLGELASLLGDDMTLESFLGSLSESPALREMLSLQYQGLIEVFDELGALFCTLRERRAQDLSASSLDQLTWLLHQMDNGRLGPLLSTHFSKMLAPLADGLSSVQQTVDMLSQFPSEHSLLQQLRWITERLSRANVEMALPESLLDSICKTAQELASVAIVNEEIGALPLGAPFREQAAWLLKGLNHLEIKGLMGNIIERSSRFTVLNKWATQANDLNRRLAYFPGTQQPIAALRWVCQLSSDSSTTALLDEWLPIKTRNALADWAAPLEPALRLAPRLAQYPSSGNWQDKLSWGARLLLNHEVPALLQQFLPESLASLLVKPFEALRQAEDFPTDASPVAQIQWITALMDKSENQALISQYMPAGYDLWLAQLGNLSALSLNATTLHRTLTSAGTWSDKVQSMGQILVPPMAEELKRHPELLLKTASWASGGNKTMVGAVLTALRLFTIMPRDMSARKKASWILQTALRETLNEYSATLSMAVNHREKFSTMLTYMRQTRSLYQAWSDAQRMEQELVGLVELLKRDLPLSGRLMPLLDALPAIPALLHAHEQYKAKALWMPLTDQLQHIGEELSRNDSAALKRVLDSLEAYVVGGLVEAARQAARAVYDYEIYDPLKFPGVDGVTLPPHLIGTGRPLRQPSDSSNLKDEIVPLKGKESESGALLPSKIAAYAMAGGGALSLFGSLALLGYALYPRINKRGVALCYPPFEQQTKSIFHTRSNSVNSVSLNAENEILISTANNYPALGTAHDMHGQTGLLQSTPALMTLGLLATASGAVMAKGIYHWMNVTDNAGAGALPPIDEFDGLELVDALDTLIEDIGTLFHDNKLGNDDELQYIIDDIDRALSALAIIEGALGVKISLWEGTTTTPSFDTVRSRRKRNTQDGSDRALMNDIQAHQATLGDAKIALQRTLSDLGDLSVLTQAKRSLTRLRRDIESLQAGTTPTQPENLSAVQVGKVEQLIQALDRLLEMPEFPPNPIDFLEIQLLALIAKHNCLDKADRNTKVKIEYVSQKAQYGLSTMTVPERRSTQHMDLIDILRREHLRFLKKHNENRGHERISFSDRTLPRALLDDVLTTDVEAHYSALIDSFKTESSTSQIQLKKRRKNIQENIRLKVELYLKKHANHPDAKFLREFLNDQKASHVKLVMPGVSATLKDTFFVGTRSGGGFLFFLNSPRTYKIPDSWTLRNRYIAINEFLHNDIRACLSIYERLNLADKTIRLYYGAIPSAGNRTIMWLSPLSFEVTHDIVGSLSEIGLAHNRVDMDTLAVSDGEISWDKWMTALSFSSTVLSLGLPVLASIPNLASRALLFGVLNTVQTLGLSIVPNIFKSMYADLPEERTQAMREVTIGLIVEAGGWSLTGLSKVGTFNALSEKLTRIVNKMTTNTKAKDFAQQFAVAWKNNRENLLGSLDQLADAMPFKMESLPMPLLNRLDKHLLKLAVTALLPDADNDTDLNNLLDQLEHRRVELLSRVKISANEKSGAKGTINSDDSSGDTTPSLLNRELQTLEQMIPSSPSQDNFFSALRGIAGQLEKLSFDTYLEEAYDSPSAYTTRDVSDKFIVAIQKLRHGIDLLPQSHHNNKIKIDFGFFYDIITTAIRRGLNTDIHKPTAQTPLNEKLRHIIHTLPPFIVPEKLSLTITNIEQYILPLNFDSYFKEGPDSPSAMKTERLVKKLVDRVQVLMRSVNNAASDYNNADTQVFNSLCARALEHITRSFPILINLDDLGAQTTHHPLPNRIDDEINQLLQMIPSTIERDDFLRTMTFIEHRVTLLDFSSHSDEEARLMPTQETQNLINRLLLALKNTKAKVYSLELTPTSSKTIRDFQLIYETCLNHIVEHAYTSWDMLPINETLQQILRKIPSSINENGFTEQMLGFELKIYRLSYINYIIEEHNSESAKETRRLSAALLSALQALQKDVDKLGIDTPNKSIAFYSLYYTAFKQFHAHQLSGVIPSSALPSSTDRPILDTSLNEQLTLLVQLIPPSIIGADDIIVDISQKIATLDYSNYYKENPSSPSTLETKRLTLDLLAGLQALKQDFDKHHAQLGLLEIMKFDFFYEKAITNIDSLLSSRTNDTATIAPFGGVSE